MSHFKSFDKAAWLSNMLCVRLEQCMYLYYYTAVIN